MDSKGGRISCYKCTSFTHGACNSNSDKKMADTLEYSSRSSDLRFVVDALSTIGPLEAGESEQRHRTYLDTFDWRLYDAGLLLWSDGRGRRSNLVLAERSGGRERARVPVRRKPSFAADLPAGPLKEMVAPVMEMRALVPVAEIDTGREHFRLLDDAAKTVVRLVVDRPVVKAREQEPLHLPVRVRLQPVRGYDDWLGRARAVCDALHGLDAARGDLLAEALALQGRRPLDYSSKLDIPLDPGMPAAAAAVRIHLHLLQTLEANVEGTCADVDSEFLHDLRVAVRRTRSALTQIKGVFPPDITEHFRAEFGWLGQVTGPTRDLDVYLLEYDKYRESLPPTMRDDLVPFHEFLVVHQRREQRRLRRTLRSERFRQLVAEWRGFLEHPVAGVVAVAPNAGRPVVDLASERIWRMYRRVRREGRAITPESPASDLHELRKSCKKLRYLIEFFSTIYPEREIKPLVKAMKKLLDNLGEFQDLEVHAHHLHDYTRQMQREGEVPLETLLAMGGLVAGLLQSQARAREQFGAQFRGFDAAENREAYRRLFRAEAAPAGAGRP